MATIVNTPNSDSGMGAAGWVVAVVVLVAIVLVGLFVWPGYAQQSNSAPSTNINVEVPTPGTGGTQ
jgi:FlaG/FlaF family flagellin (archaellin)